MSIKHKQMVRGNYALTPCKNAYNDKTSYWMSAKDHTIAVYCFTPSNQKDLDNQTTDTSWNQYIDLFEKVIRSKKS